MRNKAVEQLNPLIGTWQATMGDAWFLEPAGQEFPGSATFEWLGEAFVLFRWTTEAGEMTLVLGHNDSTDTYAALYHDERGVCRRFAMTFDGSRWTLNREDPDMFQRFTAEIEPGRISGRWEASEDQGATWRKDFALVLTSNPREADS
ncbi:hypothetical protein [Actinophytocola xanthii]|uniref:DUF1579 domain-containing protein n=1 Tax=Actinophytocola xanthii TaxID=1912961 RepID=A0A1Q8CX33_9PSEU|nr:hypothetical protein [Actinophytocola xanthii]OLF18917.1 hypothetical protein BU204_03395 [Actinophytocola xanthii]